jgi:hypothetical protein
MNKGGRLKLAVASAESLNVDPGREVVLIPAERPPALGTTPHMTNA